VVFLHLPLLSFLPTILISPFPNPNPKLCGLYGACEFDKMFCGLVGPIFTNAKKNGLCFYLY